MASDRLARAVGRVVSATIRLGVQQREAERAASRGAVNEQRTEKVAGEIEELADKLEALAN